VGISIENAADTLDGEGQCFRNEGLIDGADLRVLHPNLKIRAAHFAYHKLITSLLDLG
jgi:hypothetical protein